VYDAGILPAEVAHEALTAAGAPPAEVLELIEALRIALETPTAAQDWLAGRPLFASARRTDADRKDTQTCWTTAQARHDARTAAAAHPAPETEA
jgi:hypothetical protein